MLLSRLASLYLIERLVIGDYCELSREQEVAGVAVRNLDELTFLSLCLDILCEYYLHLNYLLFKPSGVCARDGNYFFFI